MKKDIGVVLAVLAVGAQSFVFPLAQQQINVSSALDVVRVGFNYMFD